MKPLDVLRVACLCIGAGTVGGALALFGMSVAALGNAAGHGSALPFNMFVAPGGAGMVVWPITFAAMGLPRKVLHFALPCVVAIIAVHMVSAGWLYFSESAEREYMERLPALILYGYFAFVLAVELTSPVYLAIQVWRDWQRRPSVLVDGRTPRNQGC